MTLLDSNVVDPSALVEPTRVHGAVYTSDAVFDREMEQLFTKGWVYVAHESEIPEPGDYVTRNMGHHPVIVPRAKDASLHVLANRCAHRGNKICNATSGNSSSYRCPYHGWTYANDGRLIAIPMKQGYHDRHDQVRHDLGLGECPRIDSYRGSSSPASRQRASHDPAGAEQRPVHARSRTIGRPNLAGCRAAADVEPDPR